MTARTWNSRYVDFAFASLIVLAGMISLALLLAMLAPPRLEATLTAADIVADGGFAYRTPVRAPAGFRIVGDSGAASTISRLQLREDGKLLGPDHAGHADIRQAGGGRYSHWGTGLWFSASDSSDPRTNGRSYAISARASVHPLAFAAVALFDVLVLLVSWRWIAAHAGVRRALVVVPMLVALLLAALVAVGTFGRLNEAAGEPKDAALVVATLAHALLGCAVLVAQWAAGAGLARLILGTKQSSVADIALLGFALGLPVAAVLAVLALLLPYGPLWALLALLLCWLPLSNWRPEPGEVTRYAKVAIAIMPFAIGFGCWIGLHWHGPTDTLGGSPSGDLVYYSTSIVSLSRQPYPYLNLGFEYQPLGLYFNLLFPAIGAALSRVVELDPFLFITAAGAASFVLALGMTLHSYIRGTGIFADRTHAVLGPITLALAIIVANRYPFWTVESIPVIHAVPLTIVVVYWARKDNTRARMLAFAIAVVGTALSKVVGAAVLAPFAAAASVQRYFQMPRRIRIAAIIGAGVAAAYAAYLLYRVGGANFAAAPFGPVSSQMMRIYDASFLSALPFMLRDLSAVLLAVVAFLVADWLAAIAIAFGFLLFLIFPYVLLFDFVCSTIIVGLVACDRPQRLWTYRVPLLGALLLALPAVLLTDPAGLSTGLVWLACIGATIWIALPRQRPLMWPGPGRAAAVAAVLTGLGLIAAARGELVLTSGWQAGVLTPQVRQIWLTVKQRTPEDALIFTDQTGVEATLLGSWNTYAFVGARQIFVSNLYMNQVTRDNPQRAREVLRENEAILKGDIHPSQLGLRGRYSGYYAVVSNERRLPAQWERMFQNECCALYRLKAQ